MKLRFSQLLRSEPLGLHRLFGLPKMFGLKRVFQTQSAKGLADFQSADSIKDLMNILHVLTMVLLTESLTLEGSQDGFVHSIAFAINLNGDLIMADEKEDWRIANDDLIEASVLSQAQKVEVLHWVNMKTPQYMKKLLLEQ